MSFKPRYIEAQEAEERIVALWRKEKGAYADTFNTAIDACQTIILDMYDNSSQDVVSVVRCKDCKWYEESIYPELRPMRFCYRLRNNNGVYIGYNWDGNDFCSYGERREEDEVGDDESFD